MMIDAMAKSSPGMYDGLISGGGPGEGRVVLSLA
jgi:hypothetical protein